MKRSLIIALGLMLFAASLASACQICVAMPEKSAADWVAAADLVVLARENPDKAFSLVVKETLKGTVDTEEEVDYYLDSATRKRLAADEARHLILVRTQEDGESSWRSLGMTSDGRLIRVVRELVERTPEWQKAPDVRYAYFSNLLASDHEVLRKLAHIELTRAPYATVQKLGRDQIIPRESLHAFLNDVAQTEWHRLYILLLGQSDDAADQKRVTDTMESLKEHSITVNLEAWATAYIQVTGDKGASELKREYLDNDYRTEKEKAAITNALKMHGVGGCC